MGCDGKAPVEPLCGQFFPAAIESLFKEVGKKKGLGYGGAVRDALWVGSFWLP